jgi:hypothetical protein
VFESNRDLRHFPVAAPPGTGEVHVNLRVSKIILAWAGLVFTDAHWGSVFGPEQRHLPRELLAQLAAEIRAELGGSE